MKAKHSLPEEQVFRKIYLLRQHKIMLDEDLATLYGVTTKVLNQAVKRNIQRFPADFMFQLTYEEWQNLRSQFVTSSFEPHGGRRIPPFAFTEHGVAMLSSVLNSDKAIQVNIQIMRVFIKMRQWAADYQGLLQRIEQLEDGHMEHHDYIDQIYAVLKGLVDPGNPPRRPIGYSPDIAE